MKIEWASSFRTDGSRRKPPPSSMHGWLAKMRGTLLGNETLRTKGMREMQAARNARKQKRSVQSGRSVFGFFSNRKKSANVSSRGNMGARRGHRPATLSRPPPSRRSTQRSQGAASTRPSMTPRASHNSRSSHSRPQYISRRSTRR
ncbi:hypothetical protein FPV67DRAFT_423130 [Lyophyllum atratum]|nr:hypothetical protein FPV67DRAFT_423130 [Lyophyllum atratum]